MKKLSKDVRLFFATVVLANETENVVTTCAKSDLLTWRGSDAGFPPRGDFDCNGRFINKVELS